MGMSKTHIERLFSPGHHHSRLDQVESFAALGKCLNVEAWDAGPNVLRLVGQFATRKVWDNSRTGS